MRPAPVHPVDELLPLWRLSLLGLQHVLVMYAGAVAVPLIIGRALKLPPAQVALLISADLFCSGLVTLIQSLGAGRLFGIRMPVMVMNPEPVPLDVLHRFRLETEVFDLATLRAAIGFAHHTPDLPPVHIKLDTGMHRLGFTVQEIPALLDALRGAGGLRVGSILSHLAASEDTAHDGFTRDQIRTFNGLCDRIDAVLGYRPMRHIANSAGAARFPEARLNMVRLGIGLQRYEHRARRTVGLLDLRPIKVRMLDVTQVRIWMKRAEALPWRGRDSLPD